MDLDSIINFLLIAGVVQGFGFILFTLFVRKKYNRVIIYLNLIVLFISLNNLQAWLIEQGYISTNYVIKHFEVPWYLLIFPSFYAFTTHFLRVNERVKDFVRITIWIFLVELLARLIVIYLVRNETESQVAIVIDNYTQIEEIVNLIVGFFIFINACIIIFSKHKLLEYILSFDDLIWLKWFIRLGSIPILFWVFAVILKHYYDYDAYNALRLVTSIFLYWIGYQGFYKYNVVQDRIYLRQRIESGEHVITTPESDVKVDAQNEFINEKHRNEFQRIHRYIVNEQRFLDPNLSMEDISDELRFSTSHISKLINTFSDHNFSDYINSFRVEQAKLLLTDDEFNQYTIVSIGLESGFNSKSTFYTAFKKFTSITPTAFKDS